MEDFPRVMDFWLVLEVVDRLARLKTTATVHSLDQPARRGKLAGLDLVTGTIVIVDPFTDEQMLLDPGAIVRIEGDHGPN
jgi:ABC-type transport system involved in cytochrome c biogenesis permease subunit